MKNNQSTDKGSSGRDKSSSKKGDIGSKADVPDSTEMAWNAEEGAPDYRTVGKGGDKAESGGRGDKSSKTNTGNKKGSSDSNQRRPSR